MPRVVSRRDPLENGEKNVIGFFFSNSDNEKLDQKSL